MIAVTPEVSLLYAGVQYMGFLGMLIVGVSALFSTASAVNATLFSSALFSGHLVETGLLPQRFASVGGDGESGSGDRQTASDGNRRDSGDGSDADGDEGVPKTVVVVLSALSATFAVFGSLSSITSFASLAFIAVFGGTSYLAYAERDQIDGLIAPIPVAGALGALLFFPLLLYNLYLNSPEVLSLVVLIAALVVGTELLYFEREPIEETVPWLHE